MNCDEAEKSETVHIVDDEIESRSLPRSSAVNSLILDYYKKFGRKRDLEQYFSLSTAQSEIKDTSGIFWRRMKCQTDSSDSAEAKSESSQEVCRISIHCSVPQPSSSQEDEPKSKTESESPPIINEDSNPETRHSDNESVKSDDNHSQRSLDVLFETSLNKIHSPSSSITSQRKLEWDSLADVGYGNESDRKTSASSLSTLERLALKQQYSNNDTNQNIGPPTAHSTPLEENDNKPKGKKCLKKTTKIFQKDVDVVEVNVPHNSELKPSQSINVNLTKHISFNVEKDGGISVENIKRDLSVSPEKSSVEVTPQVCFDKEIQTTLTKSTEKPSTSAEVPNSAQVHIQRVPILINVNTLKKRNRRRKLRAAKRALRNKKKIVVQEESKAPEKHVEQLSEAESFEYMPGHIYNQKQLKANQSRSSNTAGNKSSLESSGGLTTESSKDSKHSFTRDLEKGIEALSESLQKRADNSNLRKQLVKELVQKLLQSKYRDDDSTTEFLSNLSFSSKKLGLMEGHHTTSSNSDGNNTDKPKPKLNKPKKSILRGDKFNSGEIASSSQSAPNLPSASHSEKPVSSHLTQTLSSNAESDTSRERTSSDNAPNKVTSEELYKKYLEALKREDAYKRHLRDKEMFLKQKLVSSDSMIVVPPRPLNKNNSRLKDLMKDLTRNNYDDGSGDASKLEGCSSSNLNIGPNSALRNQRSHSVFTLSSGQSDCQQKKPNLKKRLQTDIKHMAGPSKDGAYHYCCCPHHSNAKVGVSDSSVQVNIQNEPQKKQNIDIIKACHYQSSNEGTGKSFPHVIADNMTGDLKYVCLCNNKSTLSQKEQESFLIYKCSRLTNRGVQLDYADVEEGKLRPQINNNDPSTSKEQCNQALRKDLIKRDSSSSINTHELRRSSKSSQTNLDIKMLCQKSSNKSITTSSSSEMKKHINVGIRRNDVSDVNRDSQNIIREGTRCVQTEISINPRISDPCLSDITIISDVDCVQLICEQYRQISKPAPEAADARSCHTQSDDEVAGASFDAIVNEPTDKNLRYTEPTEKYIGNVKETDRHLRNPKVTDIQNAEPADRYMKLTVNKQIQSDIGEIDVGENILENVPFNDNDNYKIPIQGTNMTLLVSLGSQEGKPIEYKNDRVVSQNVVTDKPQCADQGTSLTEECSKGVQSQSTDIFPVIDKMSDSKNKFGRSCNSSYGDTSESDKKNKGTSEFEKKNRGTLESDKKKRESYDYTLRASPPSKSPRRVSTDVIDDDPNFGPESKSVAPFKRPRGVSTDSKHSDSNSMPEKRTTESFKSSQVISTDFMPNDTNLINEEKTATFKNSREIGTECMPDNPSSMYQKKSAPFKNSRLVSTCIMHDNPKYKTYPKVDEKKLIHTHTDPGRYTENSCFVQTDSVTKKETETQLNDLMQPHSSNTHSSSIVSNQSKCDCEKNAACNNICQHTCSKRTIKNEGSVIESTENDLVSKRDYGVQKDLDQDAQKSSRIAEAGVGPFIKDDAGQGFERLKMKRLQRQSAVERDTISDKNSSGNVSNKNTLVEHFQAKGVIKSSSDSIKENLSGNDPILNMIRDITKRYSKNDVEKNKKKKCFKEIMTVLNYLLDTDDSTDLEEKAKRSDSGETLTGSCAKKKTGNKESETPQSKKLVDKGVQLSSKKYKVDSKTSTDIQFSTDIPSTSSDSATCKVLNKIKKECEKYHQRRCKSKNYDNSSSTSVHCEKCKRAHTCPCKSHKCKRHKSRSAEKVQKKCVAYNLIIQTSESMVSEEKFSEKNNRPLQNIIVKVPSKRKPENVPFKEMSATIEKNQVNSSPRSNPKMQRSKSCPNESELSSTEDLAKKTEVYTVQDYLERNRPDFVERCSNRQNCLKFISEVRANERAAQRDLLSLHVDRAQLREPTSDELRQLAQEIGCQLRRRKVAPKFISEREMKKHSEKIYKSLPEVVQKKEDIRKENIKKTNLLMASIFKKFPVYKLNEQNDMYSRAMEEIGAFDSVHWHMEELSSRVVAKTGIPSDRHHLGKLIIQSFRDAPDFILQIDGAIDQSETFGEVLKRTIQCAIGLKKMGVQRGDVIVLIAPNHLHLTIPYYAALYIGAAISPVASNLTVWEMVGMLLVTKPKVIFCENEKIKANIQKALKQANLETRIVTFDDTSDDCFANFMNGSYDEGDINNFKPEEFDPEDTLALITFTSGTTGLPKAAALSHKNIAYSVRSVWLSFQKFPTPTKLVIVPYPLQWITANFHFMYSPILRFTRLQSSADITTQSLWILIEKYKPTFSVISPTLMTSMLKSRGDYDLSCFETIFLGGSFVSQDLINDVKRIAPNTSVRCIYGMTEIGGLAFNIIAPVAGTVGYPIGNLQYKLMNLVTNEVVVEPYASGELWLKGPGVIKEYYNNPEATAESFSEDGWLKTGDIFYRDETGHFFFIERLKLMLKYRNNQVSPLELESLIRRHPGVCDVAVTGIPDPECGDIPVACVVRRPGTTVTAQDIKDIVKEKLSDAKQLRGGVVFMEELPTTISTKVHRRKLHDMVLTMETE